MTARTLPLAPACLLFAVAVALGGCGGDNHGMPVVPLTPEQLQDPETCKTCHPDQYRQWSGSMHAYASEDPVFRAMNKRAQRETGGALGDFCVKCHAPMAVQQGLTTDGSNLDDLPQASKGVTCYFCHAAASIEGSHNNPLKLADDDSLFGPFDNPASGTPHKAIYSRNLDSETLESAAMCGSCHDIQNLQGAHVERSYQEWQGTRFSMMPNGQTCASNGCHMTASDGAASTVSTTLRRLHAHDFPAVDLALTSFPEMDSQRAQAQYLLDGVLQPTLCYNQLYNRMELTMENITAGHGWPSGATPDRRAWVELTAYSGDTVIYSSGGDAAKPLESSSDPDLWLMRDCLFDGAGKELKMFWQATTADNDGANVPGSVVQNIQMPESFNKSHPRKFYPSSGMLPAMPDRVTLRVHLQAIGDDVLDDLVQSGDLDSSIPHQIARYELGGAAAIDWTPATAQPVVENSAPLLCVVRPIAYRTNVAMVTGNAKCVPPAPTTPPGP